MVAAAGPGGPTLGNQVVPPNIKGSIFHCQPYLSTLHIQPFLTLVHFDKAGIITKTLLEIVNLRKLYTALDFNLDSY